MRRVIKDRHGVTHRFESGVYRNTRCGSLVGARDPYAYRHSAPDDGVVDCMTCLTGPSRLTDQDLAAAPEIEVLVRLVSAQGVLVGGERPVVLRYGWSTEDAVTFDDTPIGVEIAGIAFLTEDGDEVHRTMLRPNNRFSRKHEGDTLYVTIRFSLDDG